MATDWDAPGQKAQVKYDLVQYSTGEWAIRKTEVVAIAWFPNRGAAANVMRGLLPNDAERTF